MSTDRRSALARLVAGGAALLGAGLAGLVGLAASPRAVPVLKRWRRAVSMFDLPADRPMMTVLSQAHEDGWFTTRQQTVIFLDREGDGYRAISATCTHLGCGVQWDEMAGQFKCPCHGGTFDREGKVVAGPPSRPLDRLQVRVNQKTSDLEVEL